MRAGLTRRDPKGSVDLFAILRSFVCQHCVDLCKTESKPRGYQAPKMLHNKVCSEYVVCLPLAMSHLAWRPQPACAGMLRCALCMPCCVLKMCCMLAQCADCPSGSPCVLARLRNAVVFCMLAIAGCVLKRLSVLIS